MSYLFHKPVNLVFDVSVSISWILFHELANVVVILRIIFLSASYTIADAATPLLEDITATTSPLRSVHNETVNNGQLASCL